MKLYELDAAGIDRELEQTAQGVGQTTAAKAGNTMPDGGLTTDPATGQPMGDDPMGQAGPAAGGMGLDPAQNVPDGAMGGIPTDLDDEEVEVKKINDALLTAVQGMPYVDEYEHDDNSKISPERILQMDIDGLNHLRTLVTNKINMITLHDKVGMYDDPGIKWYQHLRDFVDRIYGMKKKSDRPARKKSQGKTAKFDKRKESKNKAGKFKKKNKNL